MRAMVLEKQGPVEKNKLHLMELPQISPDEKEILLKVKYCGVCHTDLHTLEGDIPPHKLPLILGHQIVGEVVSIGEKCTRFKIGDRAGIAWLYHTCGKCLFCKRKMENLCQNAKFTGYDVDGGYAEFAVINEDFAYSLPEGFSALNVAPLLCGGIIGYRAFRLSQVKPGQILGIYGFGASAHITIQVAKYLKCKVFVFSRSEEHRQHALSLGADWVGSATELPPEKPDGSIIFAPAGWIIKNALEVLQKGGTLALAGIYMSNCPELEYEKHLYYEKSIKSVANATREDGEELLNIASKIPVKTEVNVFPLADANYALSLLKEAKIRGSAVLEI